MLSSSLFTMLKLFKTSSPYKLFDYDCVTLYSRTGGFTDGYHNLIIYNAALDNFCIFKHTIFESLLNGLRTSILDR